MSTTQMVALQLQLALADTLTLIVSFLAVFAASGPNQSMETIKVVLKLYTSPLS
jgi:hypothetical protein